MSPPDRFNVIRLETHRAGEAIDVLVDAFYDYPVMTYTAAREEPRYGPVLRLMVDVFVASRLLREYPVLAVTDARDEILAVAAVNPPRRLPFPPELEQRYQELYDLLGRDGTARLGLLSETWKTLEVPHPHYHLGMIGVRPSNQGAGHGRRLLDAVHDMSSADSASTGVGLTTEDPTNVPFYQRFGYRVIGHRQLTGIETWVFFRPNDTNAGT